MVQPFHQAFAAEPTDIVEEAPASVAADVKEQEDVVTPEPEPIIEEEVTDVDDSNETVTDEEVVEVADEQTLTDEVIVSDVQSAVSTQKPTTSANKPTTTSTANSGSHSGATATNTAPIPDSASSTHSTEDSASTTPGSSSGSGGNSDSTDEVQDNSDPTEDTDEPADTEDEVTPTDTTETDTSGGGGSSSDSSSNADAIDEDVEATLQDLEEKSDTVVEVGAAGNDQNFYQFSKQSCIAVGDGTYHCTQKETPDIDPSSAVYAELGPSGNLEIFLRTSKGTTKQLTDNNRDDTAPHYDPESMQIVWQRMVDSRYQIIVYDLNEQEETQLTFSRTNNMEPKVSPDGIVWQAWDGNDWEIMYFDGTYTDQITDNNAQDVTPVIQDGYIVWSVLGGESNLARVYSIDTGEMMSITGHEGGTIANPRFVLVYDTQFENGDVVTQGFDPETGMARPISAQPGPEPVNIPTTDTTGEIIALIQNKSSSKDDKDGVIVKTDGTPDMDVSTSSASTTDTLVLGNTLSNPSSSTPLDILDEPATTTDVVVDVDFTLDEFDLVIVKTPEEGIVSTSTKEDIPMMDRAVVDAEVAATSSQSTNR